MDPASLSLVVLGSIGSNGACVAHWGTINELVITIAISVITFAASLAGRKTLTLLPAALLALKRT